MFAIYASCGCHSTTIHYSLSITANDAIPHNDKVDYDDDQCFGMMLGFSVTIVVLVAIMIGITAVMWCLYKHIRGSCFPTCVYVIAVKLLYALMYFDKGFLLLEAVIPKTQQLTTNTIKMQSSPAYAPMSQDNMKSSTVPQYETIQHCNYVRMDTNPTYITHKKPESYSDMTYRKQNNLYV